MAFTNIVIVVLALFNVLTLFAIRERNKTVRQNYLMITFVYLQISLSLHAGMLDEEHLQRQKAEIRFFLQSLLNGLIVLSVPLCFDLVSRLATAKWGYYWTTIIPWLLMHCSNG